MVGEADLADLLPLVEAYCDFYDSAPGAAALEALSRALLAAPDREGVQLLARNVDGRPIGFASLYWAWSTTRAGRIGIMNDLYVAPQGRGGGTATALMEACVERCREHGAVGMEWATAPDNARAQALYDRFGGVREEWVNYGVEL